MLVLRQAGLQTRRRLLWQLGVHYLVAYFLQFLNEDLLGHTLS